MHSRPFVYFVFLTGAILSSCSQPIVRNQLRISLHSNWEFSSDSQQQWFPATVPGVVHLDLLANSLIDDPFVDNNELKQQWIENDNWNYRCVFNIDSDILTKDHVELKFDGLDTYAEVVLNGQKIIVANNMFRSWTALVKDVIQEGENRLEVKFLSPIKINQLVVSNYHAELPSGNEADSIEVKVSAFTRKAAYHFGWDWGPRFVTAGIWKQLTLTAWNDARITDVYVRTDKIETANAQIICSVEVEAATAGRYQLDINGEILEAELFSGSNIIKHSFIVNDPKLWWCIGEGEPYLYTCNVSLFSRSNLLDSRFVKYGIRTVKLIKEADSIGTSFFFLLNNRPVFMQGANYIPQDMFLPRVDNSKYRDLLIKASDANMNMIRVWGGGVYESDIFYDLCDSLGILVWQDLMFANSLYPEDDSFIENVNKEVQENVLRLRSHPCIALWCGNNEIEVAWSNWGWQKKFNYTGADSTRIWNNYLSMFHQDFPEIISRIQPDANYTPTSPLSNWGTAENFNHASMHYWGVWHGRKGFESFNNNVGRFMVEYGFQSFPAMNTLRTFISDSALQLDSEVMRNRQKSYVGNGLILEHIKQYYKPPISFEHFVELSQRTQAIGLQIAIAAHKSKQPHCMGTLLWQFNDCWPGPSWSIIDYNGNPKAAYSVVKEEFTK